MGEKEVPLYGGRSLHYTPEDIVSYAVDAGLHISEVTNNTKETTGFNYPVIGDSEAEVSSIYIENALKPYQTAENVYRHTQLRKSSVDGHVINWESVNTSLAEIECFEPRSAFAAKLFPQYVADKVRKLSEKSNPIVMGFTGITRDSGEAIAQEIRDDPTNARQVIHINIEDVITGQLITLMGGNLFGLVREDPHSDSLIERVVGQELRIRAMKAMIHTYVQNNGHFSMGYFTDFTAPYSEKGTRQIGASHTEHPLRPFVLPIALQTIGEIIDKIEAEHRGDQQSPVIIISGSDNKECYYISSSFDYIAHNVQTYSQRQRVEREVYNWMRENYSPKYWDVPEIREMALREVLFRSVRMTKSLRAKASENRYSNLFEALQKLESE